MIRILHTADWHLGHRLYGNDRSTEHERALNWLLDVIRDESVDVLIVAGDVFDSMNPSNQARNQYYHFLSRLRETRCHTAVIVGGNHDSPTQLDAPATLLRYLNVHVVGGARDAIADQIVPVNLPGAAAPALVVAAVPYLRDRDLKYSVLGESASDKVVRLRASIRQHYVDIARAAREARGGHLAVPIVATGHLYAAGATDAEDRSTHIYLADRNNIEAGHFDACFDYVALGHIHQPQRVGGREHIRYAGSLIPLTFGEARTEQSVCLVEVGEAGKAVLVRKLPVPIYRRLHTLRGTAAEVRQQITQLTDRQRGMEADDLAPWLDVRVETAHSIPGLREDLERLVTPTEEEDDGRDLGLPRILRCMSVLPAGSAAEPGEPQLQNLEELHPEEVFFRLCHSSDEPRPDYPELLETFRELRSWMEDEQSV